MIEDEAEEDSDDEEEGSDEEDADEDEEDGEEEEEEELERFRMCLVPPCAILLKCKSWLCDVYYLQRNLFLARKEPRIWYSTTMLMNGMMNQW